MKQKDTKNLSLYKGVVDEIVEKKSRFIVSVIPVNTTGQVDEELEKIRKKYYDARHNCFAYIIGDEGQEIRCSDDGEPSATAGKPMLEVIQGSGVKNILVVVSRYFGGTKLGTGGLVRAYTQATQLGIAGSVVIEKEWGQYLEIRTDYNGIGKVQYILGEHQVHIVESQYTDVVNVRAIVPYYMLEGLIDLLVEGTHGKAELTKGEKRKFAIIEGQLQVW